MLDDAELTRRFSYHAPKGDQPQRYTDLREDFRSLATLIDCLAPDSREKDQAMVFLESAGFWANAAIARAS